MNRRLLAVAAVIALVAFAGCSGLMGTDAPESETNGSTETTEAELTLSDVEYPDGASADGIDDAEAVVAAHGATLNESDYSIEIDQTTVRGEESRNVTYAVRSSLDDQRMVGSIATEGVNNQWYQNATHQHTNLTANGDTRLRVQESSGTFEETHRQETARRLVNDLLTTGNFTAEEAVERDGETLVRYEMTAYNDSNQNFETENASGHALVSESGIVHEVRVTAAGTTSDGTAVSYEASYRVTALGDVTVEPPAWVEDARAQN